MFSSVIELYNSALEAIASHVIIPAMFELGLSNFAEDGYIGAEWFLVGCLQIITMVLFLRTLEKWRPAQVINNPHAVRVDVLYTLLHRLGFFRIALFFLLDPLFDELAGQANLHGWTRINLENIWPTLTAIPLASFLIYLVLFDFFDYWYHRLAHRFNRWWALHAVHHSQQDMTYWSDNRNHLLDDLLRDTFFATVALVIGVEPSQFIWLVAISQWLQSLQHANVRLHFGALGERLVVSPRFHRLHHAIGIGHEMPGKPNVLGGCNFGILFPWWDMLFRTADFTPAIYDTGIRDQLAPPQGHGRDYGQGFWAQQWLGLKRFISPNTAA